MLHAVIMAGGSGTRFWPESRRNRPKQFLELLGSRSMLQQTLDRLAGLVPPERILVVTNARLVDQVAEQLPELPRDAIVGEPAKRNTAPCIGLAANEVRRRDPHATMVVLPADHTIQTTKRFQSALEQAAELAEQQDNRLVTFGIRPTYAAESFGYIERGEPLSGAAGAAVFRVKRFHEKPEADIAREYVEAGSFYWNSGIFVWKAETILEALAAYEPEMHEHLKQIADGYGTPDYVTVFEREFAAIRGESIDFAVMERAADDSSREVIVIEAPFDWDDVGSWQALSRLRGTDENGNTIAGKYQGLKTTGSIVLGDERHLIATIGLEDVIVVHTPDATLVASKHDEESIRKLVELMEEKGLDEYL